MAKEMAAPLTHRQRRMLETDLIRLQRFETETTQAVERLMSHTTPSQGFQAQ